MRKVFAGPLTRSMALYIVRLPFCKLYRAPHTLPLSRCEYTWGEGLVRSRGYLPWCALYFSAVDVHISHLDGREFLIRVART